MAESLFGFKTLYNRFRRPLPAPWVPNHFYDPIYDQGWIGYTSSKVWAYSSEKQVAFLGGKSQTAGFAQFFIGNELSADDYSYQRALYDYAIGDRKRAMTAMGHIMHLLEDANVPDHTRNDTHLPWAGTESPYEKEMAKWNPGNLDIASKIFTNGVRPILSSELGDYFDKIAKYSNGYFFSEDTINITRYARPIILGTGSTNYEEKLFALGADRNGSKFKLAILNIKKVRNIFTISRATLIDEEIGSVVLDGYWSRLSKDFVPLGAGALKLFLGQAELVKREYAKNQQVVQKPGPLSGVLGLLGVSGQDEPQPVFDPGIIDAVLNQPMVSGNDVGVPPTSLPPSPTSLTPSATPSTTPPSSPSPTPVPAFSNFPTGGGGGSGSGNGSVPTPSATPSPTSSPTPTPSASPTPSSAPSPSPTPSPTLTPEPVPPGAKVVINEIAWMGTATSSNDEWLELYNITPESVDLSGWRLHSLTGKDPDPDITLASKSIEPFGFFLLERTNDTTVSDISADQIYTGALNNGGEVLELRDKNGGLQDLVSKSADGWYAGENEGKYTMERVDPTKVGDNSANWGTNNGITINGHDAAGNPINGTPRARNSAYQSQKSTTITDLAADPSSFFGKIKLTWSAPKDDDDPQSNLKYDLRYATQSFDVIDWESAAKVASPSIPALVANYSQPQSSSFTIYDYNRDYYFAIKTTDGSSWSEISNQVQYTIKPAISDTLTTFRGPAHPTVSWEFQVPDALYLNQPVITKDGATVYFGAPTPETPTLGKVRLYAVNPDGAEKWHFEEEHTGVPTTPAVSDDGTVYFGHLDPGSAITALNPDGILRWQYNIGNRVNGVGVDENGGVYFTSENRTITKVSPRGDGKWQIWGSSVFDSTPVAIPGDGDKDIYLGFDWTGLPGFYRLKGDDGTAVWQSRVSDNYVYRAYDPVFDKATGRFYTATTAGHIISVSRSDGAIDSRLFAFGAVATTKTAIFDDVLVVGVDFSFQNPASGQAVIALDKTDKSVKWTFPVDSPVNKQIAVDADGNLYFATYNYAAKTSKLYSLDKNGQKRWVLDLASATELYPVLGENAVFIGINGPDGGKLLKIADY